MNNYYKTSDLGLATALITFGFDLIDLDKSIPSKVIFVFQSDKEIANRVNMYWSDNLKLSVRRYFENLKMLKTQIYS